MRLIIPVLCGLFLAPFAQAADLQVNIGSRFFLVHTPPNPSGAAVIVLHGGNQTAAAFANGDPVGMRAASDEDGFTVAYGQAVGNNWNDSNQGPSSTVDDVTYMRNVVAALDTMPEFNVDPARIYVAGVSNGGMMVGRLACQTDLFSGHSIVSMTMIDKLRNTMCSSPANPAPLVVFNGTADASIPYNGGKITNAKTGISAKAAFQFWAKSAGCSPGSVSLKKTAMPRIAGDSTTVEKRTYGCGVDQYVITGGGHNWPGQASATAGSGTVSKFPATDTMLKAFGLR